MTDKQRMSIQETAPKLFKAMYGLQNYVASSSLGHELIELIEVRASQINHCAFCLDMHARGARKAGVDQRKLDTVAAFREANGLFDERETAALAFAEQVTLISEGGVSDEVWDELNRQFSEQEVVDILATVNTINAWNRLMVTTLQNLLEE